MPRRRLPPDWAALPDEELLDLRLSELPLRLEGSALKARIAELRTELDRCELGAPVHFYLSDEWFTADGTVAIAVPFSVAHPRLERLERAHVFEVEGGDHEWCMRILRHEAGHAIDNAYKLMRGLRGAPPLVDNVDEVSPLREGCDHYRPGKPRSLERMRAEKAEFLRIGHAAYDDTHTRELSHNTDC
jgi:hypothetical protein